MPVKKSVVAAIASAVNTYIQDDEAAMLAQQQKRLAQTPTPPYSPWAMAGRAASMEMRRTWQLRLVR